MCIFQFFFSLASCGFRCALGLPWAFRRGSPLYATGLLLASDAPVGWRYLWEVACWGGGDAGQTMVSPVITFFFFRYSRCVRTMQCPYSSLVEMHIVPRRASFLCEEGMTGTFDIVFLRHALCHSQRLCAHELKTRFLHSAAASHRDRKSVV